MDGSFGRLILRRSMASSLKRVMTSRALALAIGVVWQTWTREIKSNKCRTWWALKFMTSSGPGLGAASATKQSTLLVK
eukprot:CAMPEP_0181452714 /NCGR_PEP_ID=MMETSP1110-20121109/29348_1 /TAXON_ID=174948 /ORGANISM="Symbiodinium sp., Strain CCMP421" /LENGTH=77 /DNA_ID=CAMNT_0023577003 /DNA_START=434 /DNA_END=664 /DNA_ORIENTATION=+